MAVVGWLLALAVIQPQTLLRRTAATVSPTAHRRCPPIALPQRDATRSKALRDKKPAADVEKDKHLYFDRVELTVQGGHGGDGAVVRPDGGGINEQAAERSELVMPSGGNGGGVVLFVDPAMTDLLHLRVCAPPYSLPTRRAPLIGLQTNRAADL